MSNTLEIYCVNFDRLRSVYGRKDDGLLYIIENNYGDEITEFDWSIAEGSPTAREVLRDIAGGKTTFNTEYAYSFAAELIVRHLGKRIHSVEGGTPSGSQCRAIDVVLIKHGFDADFTTAGMFAAGMPAPFPAFSEEVVAGIGHLEPDVIERNIWKLDTPLNLMGVENRIAAWIIQIPNWMRTAMAENEGLIFCV